MATHKGWPALNTHHNQEFQDYDFLKKHKYSFLDHSLLSKTNNFNVLSIRR